MLFSGCFAGRLLTERACCGAHSMAKQCDKAKAKQAIGPSMWKVRQGLKRMQKNKAQKGPAVVLSVYARGLGTQGLSVPLD